MKKSLSGSSNSIRRWGDAPRREQKEALGKAVVRELTKLDGCQELEDLEETIIIGPWVAVVATSPLYRRIGFCREGIKIYYKNFWFRILPWVTSRVIPYGAFTAKMVEDLRIGLDDITAVRRKLADKI